MRPVIPQIVSQGRRRRRLRVAAATGSAAVAAALLALIYVHQAPSSALEAADGPSIEVGFTPGSGGRSAEDLVLAAIQEARQSIHVAAYSFTSRPVAQALVDAEKRGVNVQIVVDRKENSSAYTAASFTANQGVPTRTNGRYAIMHDKFIIIDGNEVEAGSFNFSAAAAVRNAENAMVIKNDPLLASAYEKEWERLWAEGEDVTARY